MFKLMGWFGYKTSPTAESRPSGASEKILNYKVANVTHEFYCCFLAEQTLKKLDFRLDR